VSARAAAASGLVVGSLILLAAWLFDVPVGRAALLAPVVVVVAAAVAGLAVFWGRAALANLREAKHPRLIVGAGAALLVIGVVFTVLGIELPRE
jgi:hypothetical protein